MKLLHSAIAIAVGVFAATAAQAANFTPKFSDFPFPGTQFTVTPEANAFYSANYGITVDNAYLYVDGRDTFDGIGIANGTVAEIGTPQSGRVNFIDTTNFVTVDYLAIQSTTYEAFASDGTLLDSFTASPSTGTNTLTSSGPKYISYVLFSSSGGFGTISGLEYNFDGTTGGGNTDLPPVSGVPEPETYAMMLLGLAAVGTAANKRRRQA